METKDVILQLRTQKGLSQDELAERILVTRQAVSRWENGETVPNTETLKLLSKEFDVSINTLLGTPRQLIQEINDLHVEGLPKVEKLNALVGRYVNLAYPLPSGAAVNFLNDQTTYLGTQLESEFGGERCFGVLAGMDFILISTYGPEGEAPELVLYKKR